MTHEPKRSLCHEVREQLAAALDQPLGDAEARRVREHVDGCDECTQVESWIHEVDVLAAAAPERRAPDAAYFAGVRHQVMDRLAGEAAQPAAKPSRPWWSLPALRWGGGVLAAALVAVVGWQIAGNQETSLEALVQEDAVATKPSESPPEALRSLGYIAGEEDAVPPTNLEKKQTLAEAQEQVQGDEREDADANAPLAEPTSPGMTKVVEGAPSSARDVLVTEEIPLPRSALPAAGGRSEARLRRTLTTRRWRVLRIEPRNRPPSAALVSMRWTLPAGPPASTPP